MYIEEYNFSLDLEGTLSIGSTLTLKEVSYTKGEILMISANGLVSKITDVDFINKYNLSTNDWSVGKFQPLNQHLTNISSLDTTSNGIVIKNGSKWTIDNSTYAKNSSNITINGVVKTIGENPIFTIKTNLALGTRTATSMIINNDNGTSVTLPIVTNTQAGLMSSTDKVNFEKLLRGDGDMYVLTNAKNLTTSAFEITDNKNTFKFDNNSILFNVPNGSYSLNHKNIKFTDTSANKEDFTISNSSIGGTIKNGNNLYKWSINGNGNGNGSFILPFMNENKYLVTSVNGEYSDEFGNVRVRVPEYDGGYGITISNNTISLKDHTHKIADIEGLSTTLANKADIMNPTLHGNVNVPTYPSNTNSTLVASTAFVKGLNYLPKSDLPTYLPNEKNFILKFNGLNTEGVGKYTYNGSTEKSVDIVFGANLTTTATANKITVVGVDTKYTAGNGLNIDSSNKINIDNGFIPSLSITLGTSNLNDITVPGFYRQPQNANALLDRNYPINLAGTLCVYNDAGTTQVYYLYGGNHSAYMRSKYGDNWSVWTKFYTSNNLPLITEAELNNPNDRNARIVNSEVLNKWLLEKAKGGYDAIRIDIVINESLIKLVDVKNDQSKVPTTFGHSGEVSAITINKFTYVDYLYEAYRLRIIFNNPIPNYSRIMMNHSFYCLTDIDKYVIDVPRYSIQHHHFKQNGKELIIDFIDTRNLNSKNTWDTPFEFKLSLDIIT